MQQDMQRKGLGPQQAPEAQAQPGPAQGGQQPGMTDQLAGVLSEEQKMMHNKVYGIGVSLLYTPQFKEKAKEVFAKAPTPAAGASAIMVALGARILKSARDKGQEIPGEIVATAGWMLMQEVAEFAENILKVQMSDDQIEAAFYSASEQFQQIAASKGGVRVDATPEMRQQIMAEGGDMEAMQQKKVAGMIPQPPQAPQPPQPGTRGLGG